VSADSVAYEVVVLADGYLPLLTLVLPLLDELLAELGRERADVAHTGRCDQGVTHQALQLEVQLIHRLCPAHLVTGDIGYCRCGREKGWIKNSW